MAMIRINSPLSRSAFFCQLYYTALPAKKQPCPPNFLLTPRFPCVIVTLPVKRGFFVLRIFTVYAQAPLPHLSGHREAIAGSHREHVRHSPAVSRMAGFGFQSLIQLFLLLAHISGAARTGRSPQYLKEVPNIWQARPVLASRSPCGALSASRETTIP